MNFIYQHQILQVTISRIGSLARFEAFRFLNRWYWPIKSSKFNQVNLTEILYVQALSYLFCPSGYAVNYPKPSTLWGSYMEPSNPCTTAVLHQHWIDPPLSLARSLRQPKHTHPICCINQHNKYIIFFLYSKNQRVFRYPQLHTKRNMMKLKEHSKHDQECKRIS